MAAHRIALAGLVQGSLTIVAGAAMLLAANFALSGQLAWTPGGYGVAFGRMLQDGIVTQYLRDHCPDKNSNFAPIATNCLRRPTTFCGATACSIRSAALRA